MIEPEYWQGWQSSQTAKEQSFTGKCLSEIACSNESKLKPVQSTETEQEIPWRFAPVSWPVK